FSLLKLTRKIGWCRSGTREGTEKASTIEHDWKLARGGNSERDAVNCDNGISGRITISDKHKGTKAYKLLYVSVQQTQKQTSAQQVEPDLVQRLDQNRTAGFR